MKETGMNGANAEVGRLSERIWPQALCFPPSVPEGEVCAREAALRSRTRPPPEAGGRAGTPTERNEASGQRRRSNRALFYDEQYLGYESPGRRVQDSWIGHQTRGSLLNPALRELEWTQSGHWLCFGKPISNTPRLT